ncbi:hypothetical protein BpHYR1_013539 [Brachionus plicatilis]
MLEQG